MTWLVTSSFRLPPTSSYVRTQSQSYLATGEYKLPYPWQPSIVDVQILRIGNILNIAFPGEFTTMSGRRVITAVQSVAGNNYQVVMSGLANTYSSYIATTEEYGVQRYEGASTIYGPDTLPAYINQYIKLARALVNNQQIQPTGLQPPYLLPVQIQLVGPVLFDTPALGKQFGDVVMDVQPQYRRGQQVFVSFVAANPRNDRKQESSFLTVEMLYNNNWPVVAVDGNWETKFYWNRTDPVSGMSRAIIQWDIPMQQRAGKYRIRYFGSSKGLDGTISQFVGKSFCFPSDAIKREQMNIKKQNSEICLLLSNLLQPSLISKSLKKIQRHFQNSKPYCETRCRCSLAG